MNTLKGMELAEHWGTYVKLVEIRNQKREKERQEAIVKRLQELQAKPWYLKLLQLPDHIEAELSVGYIVPQEPTIEGYFDYLTHTGRV